MSKFLLASRAIRELIALLGRGKERDDVANYPAIGKLIEENPRFPELMQSLGDLSDFRPIPAGQREAGRMRLEADIRRREHRRGRRIALTYAASFVGAVILAGATVWLMSDGGRQDVITYNVPAERYDTPVIVLDNGETLPLTTPVKIADGGGRIDDLEGRLVYELTNTISTEIKDARTLRIITPERARLAVHLPDDTRVTLNANSELVYPSVFGAGERKVLLHGEAFFEVTKDARPFIVNSREVDVEVYGTSFNVNGHNPEQITVALVEGSVGIGMGDGTPVMLTPSQAGTVDLRRGKTTVANVDLNHYTGWVQDISYYTDIPLYLLLNNIASWYGVEFIYDRRVIDGIRLSAAHFNRSVDIETILTNLNMMYGELNFARKENNVYEITAR